jgi:hypothetical protein
MSAASACSKTAAPRTYVPKRFGVHTRAVLDEVDARYGDEPLLANGAASVVEAGGGIIGRRPARVPRVA